MNIPENLKIMGVSPYIFWAIVGCVFALAVFLFYINRNGMTVRLPLFLMFSSFLGVFPGGGKCAPADGLCAQPGLPGDRGLSL